MIANSKRWRSILLFALLSTTTIVHAEEELLLTPASEIATEIFAKLPAFESPKLSPDGNRMAITATVNGKSTIVIRDLFSSAKGARPEARAIPLGRDIHLSHYRWASNTRLLITFRTLAPYTKVAGGKINVERIASVKYDGTDLRFVTMNPLAVDSGLHHMQYPRIVHTLPNEPNHILAAITSPYGQHISPIVEKIDLTSGGSTAYDSNRNRFTRWVSDNDGNLRIGVKLPANKESKIITYYRKSHNDSWETLFAYSYFDTNRYDVASFDKDNPNILLLEKSNSSVKESAHKKLYRYDLIQRKVLGEHRNKREKAITGAMNDVFKDFSVELVSHDENYDRYIYKIHSDVKAPTYYLYDYKEGTNSLLAQAYEKLEGVRLSPMEKMEYQARDGLTIPALLTKPVKAENGKLPFIILVHGGPWAHDKWGFDSKVQFFASRGYGVFQPQFRGSTGHGYAHEVAGYKQWGYKIQDDISDGVSWLIKEGLADKNRICIVGASFGGYAATVGLFKTPDMYRCAISENGIMDLKKARRTLDQYVYSDLNKKLFNDGGQLDQVSPIKQLESITKPLMLIASTNDSIVPYKHSKKMYRKMKSAKKEVEYVKLKNGEHWRNYEPHEIMKFRAMEEFLAKYLE